MEHSAFHQSLHKWINNNPNKPLLHFDIHGRIDYLDKAQVDVGVSSINEWFPEHD
jgi:hypothetical protein